VSVCIGTLRNSGMIRSETGEVIPMEFEGRAAWSWLRLQHGRSIDAEIKAALGEKKKEGERLAELMNFLDRSIPTSQRQTQFIYETTEKGTIVKAVASLDHLLIPPEEVERVAHEILADRQIRYNVDATLEGLVSVDPQEVAGLYVGFHLHPGDILTRTAISVSSYLYTIICTNPITWAGIGGFGRFGVDNKAQEFERVLRIQKKSELRPRLEKAIDETTKMMDRLKGMVDFAKTNNVDPKEARIILGAFTKAYGLGDKVLTELLGRLRLEDKTTFGMAQAASYEARHGEAFRETPEGQKPKARSSVATIGAAALTIQDPKDVAEKCRKWLLGRLEELPTEEDLERERG